jgi:zinc transporter ZupT
MSPAAESFDGPLVVLVPLFALVLAAVHLFVGRLRLLEVVPRSRWLSIAGGVSVAYVFVHLLPEVGAAAAAVDETDSPLTAVENHVYVIALLGFAAFYGLERFAREARTDPDDLEVGPPTNSDRAFWLHTVSFAVYNALVGYLLVHQEDPDVTGTTFFVVAMALHFLVNDIGLREHHGDVYHRYGRWMLAGAVVLGVTVGYAVTVTELFTNVLFAFLAGGIVLNAIKEELPPERRSRFWAFAAGAAIYTVLLLVT